MEITSLKVNQLEVHMLNTKVLLKWNVVNYKHRFKYTIARSIDGIEFKVIGTVENKEACQYLTFIDPRSLESKIFYRITEIQQRGKFYSLVYSNTCSILVNKVLIDNEPINRLMF